MVSRKIRFYGRVQGINFRRNVMREALSLGVRGWVRNEMDGSVSAVFSGTQESVDMLLDFCLNRVPLARVDRYTIEDHEEESFDTFSIL